MIPYCGQAPLPAELWSRWNLDPWLLAGFAGVALIGVTVSRRAGSHDRRASYGAAAWLVLAILFVSPFCALSSALFSARVVHHVVLIAVAAPLLALAVAGRDSARLTRSGMPVGAFVAQMVAIWVWHAPGFYAAALGSDAIYWLMQATLFGTASSFWAVVLAPRQDRLGPLLLLVGTSVHMALLGALITFAPEPLYAPHFLTTAPWGLSALEDQQLAGLIMWVPAALPYLVASLALCASMMRPARSERWR